MILCFIKSIRHPLLLKSTGCTSLTNSEKSLFKINTAVDSLRASLEQFNYLSNKVGQAVQVYLKRSIIINSPLYKRNQEQLISYKSMDVRDHFLKHDKKQVLLVNRCRYNSFIIVPENKCYFCAHRKGLHVGVSVEKHLCLP